MKKILLQNKEILTIVIAIILVMAMLINPNITMTTLIEYAVQKPFRVMLIIWFLYALKSVILVVPIIVLQLMVGNIFSTWTAVLVNLIGIMICCIIPYKIGEKKGITLIEKVIRKYPTLLPLIEKQQGNSLFFCFIMRTISGIPNDVVTMYIGAIKIPFWQNLLGGTLGMMPSMLLATFLGHNIRNPWSPEFWFSVVSMVLFFFVSVFAYYMYMKKQK